MNLAICAPGELFGGVERQVLDLAGFYARTTGSAPAVVLFHDGELARQLRFRGVEPVVVTGRHRYDTALVRDVGRVLDVRECRVVHVHGYKATVICGLARRGRRVRILKTEHGLLEMSPKQPVATLKSALNFLLDQYHTRRFVDEVVYVSDDIARHLGPWHRGLATGTIRNGIDPLGGSGLMRPADLPDDRLNFGIIGRITPVKGIPVAIRALARPEVPSRLHLVIIGSGEQVAELKELALAVGVSERVHFLGFKSNVSEYLAHLDAVLMPSRHEGLPYVLLEAMSLARPLLCSRVGGLAETLRDGLTGMLLPAGDVAAWASAMARLSSDEDLRRRLGEAARSEQTAAYSLERMGNEYLTRIRRLASRAP